jgi:hypothetical protein
MLDDRVMRAALNLPTKHRLELARRLVENVSDPLRVGIARIESVAAGRVAGLTDEQYRAALR